MNHVPTVVPADHSLVAGGPADSLTRARASIEEILAAAHEAGDWEAVRTLHAVSALLAAVRH